MAAFRKSVAGAELRGCGGGTYVSRQLPGLLVAAVEDLLVVVHPDFGQPHVVAGDDLRAFGEGVRALGAEHVADDGAGDDLQLSAALPHLQVGRGDS